MIALVAVDAAGVCGHILFSLMTAPGPLRTLALAPLAVAPGRQGRGVGSALVRAGLGAARAAAFDGVFVLGDPPYYARFGFSAAAATGFESPYSGPHFMGLWLKGEKSGAGPSDGPTSGPHGPSRGVLAHPRAFAALQDAAPVYGRP